MHGVGRLFSNLYQRVMGWSRHPRATRYLAVLSFAESSFFPIPPDVMLAPMCLAKPERAYWLAFVTTVSSVLGGLLGYVLGLWAMEMVLPWLLESKYAQAYALAQQWFVDYGVWAVLLAGFSPIPYKVFTIAAGAASMAVFPFVIVDTSLFSKYSTNPIGGFKVIIFEKGFIESTIANPPVKLKYPV